MGLKVVLLSGGWESVACLIMAKKKHERVTAMFFDYDQPYLKQEIKAIAKLSSVIDFELLYISIADMERNGKVFVDRNKRFIEHAAKHQPDEIWLGSRAPLHIFDKYKDSNWQFAQEMEREIGVPIKTPLVMYPKPLVKYYVTSNGVPADLIYSSEGYDYESQRCN